MRKFSGQTSPDDSQPDVAAATRHRLERVQQRLNTLAGINKANIGKNEIIRVGAEQLPAALTRFCIFATHAHVGWRRHEDTLPANVRETGRNHCLMRAAQQDNSVAIAQERPELIVDKAGWIAGGHCFPDHPRKDGVGLWSSPADVLESCHDRDTWQSLFRNRGNERAHELKIVGPSEIHQIDNVRRATLQKPPEPRHFSPRPTTHQWMNGDLRISRRHVSFGGQNMNVEASRGEMLANMVGVCRFT